MTKKTTWDLLTDEEQVALIDALDKSTIDAGICIVDQEIDEVVDVVAKLAVNALPPRLFKPRLPEGWQPIATAPKDGAVILIAYGDSTHPRHSRLDRHVYEARWSDEQLVFTSLNGFIQFPEATHWMPMPAAPGHEALLAQESE